MISKDHSLPFDSAVFPTTGLKISCVVFAFFLNKAAQRFVKLDQKPKNKKYRADREIHRIGMFLI